MHLEDVEADRRVEARSMDAERPHRRSDGASCLDQTTGGVVTIGSKTPVEGVVQQIESDGHARGGALQSQTMGRPSRVAMFQGVQSPCQRPNLKGSWDHRRSTSRIASRAANEASGRMCSIRDSSEAR